VILVIYSSSDSALTDESKGENMMKWIRNEFDFVYGFRSWIMNYSNEFKDNHFWIWLADPEYGRLMMLVRIYNIGPGCNGRSSCLRESIPSHCSALSLLALYALVVSSSSIWVTYLWPNPRKSLRFYSLLSKITDSTLPALRPLRCTKVSIS
jgi:hypothetical protein